MCAVSRLGFCAGLHEQDDIMLFVQFCCRASMRSVLIEMVQGPQWWSYKGERLTDLRERLESTFAASAKEE